MSMDANLSCFNKNELEILRENDRQSRKEIDDLKHELLISEDKINFLHTEINEIKTEKDALAKLIEVSIYYLEDKVDALNTTRLTRIESLEKKADSVKGGSNNAQVANAIQKLENKIEEKFLHFESRLYEMRQEWNKSLHDAHSQVEAATHACRAELEARIEHTESCLKTETFLHTIHKICDARKKNVDSYSEYFYGAMQRYKMQLRWNGHGDNLVVFLCVCGDEEVEGSLRWPFEADVTIKIGNKVRSTCRAITNRRCLIQKPTRDSYRASDEFRFAYGDLEMAGVLKDDCVIVECFVKFD